VTRLRPVVVVHYHEISLKRGNRPLFLRHLARNLSRALADLGPVTVRQRPGSSARSGSPRGAPSRRTR
jgi:adenylyl- and sulfurtransferase ThiI